ncbi:MAG: zinc metalloprotease HtpX [Thermaerobacter sp.]|nr:zinc metalloprotease HtpX [Thermaerobacter sp.]MDA8144779.1 zinc metalloprotease HtpX [Thermaerobacter sp.]
MNRKAIGRDTGLTVRMFLTMFLLAALYLAFVFVLVRAGVGIIFVALIAGGLLVVQYYLSDTLVLASVGARVVTAQEQPQLHAIVGKLAATADLPMPRVAVVDSNIPNAFATGRNPRHAVVAVTSALLQRLPPQELEAVLGHELTHVKNRDMAVITVASFFATVAAFLVQQFMFWGIFDEEDSRSNYTWLIYLASILVWLISYFLINALSRYREYAADRGSAILTGSPSQLESALTRISGQMERIPNRDLRQAERLNAFYIIPAVSRQSLMELFSTHPSLEHRLAQLQRIERQMEGV